MRARMRCYTESEREIEHNVWLINRSARRVVIVDAKFLYRLFCGVVCEMGIFCWVSWTTRGEEMKNVEIIGCFLVPRFFLFRIVRSGSIIVRRESLNSQ